MSPTWRIDPDIALASVDRMRLADEIDGSSGTVKIIRVPVAV